MTAEKNRHCPTKRRKYLFSQSTINLCEGHEKKKKKVLILTEYDKLV